MALEWAWQKFFLQTIEIFKKTNKIMKTYPANFQKSGRGIFGRLKGVRVGVATWVNEIAPRLCL